MSHQPISRRSFLYAAGALGAGALLPRRAAAGPGAFATKHVVILGIAGGLRLRESLGMAEGATMPNLFGDVPLAPGFGAGPAGPPRLAREYVSGAPQAAVPTPLHTPLYQQGTLVRNLRYAEGAPGHLQGQACLISGAYNQIENRGDAHAPAPTLFELHRRQKNAPATDAWYISGVGGFYRALLYSGHPEYGPRYGGSFLSPPQMMSALLPLLVSGKRSAKVEGGRLRLPVLRDTREEMTAVARLRDVLDRKFPPYQDEGRALRATSAENLAVEEHLAGFYGDPDQRAYYPPEVGIGLRRADGFVDGTADALTIYHAEQVLRRFRPAVMAITLIDIDGCHFNFNDYLRGQIIADACARHLWEMIQSTDGLRDQTTLLILPEHGRHLQGNGQSPDSLGRSGVDHGNGDDGDRDVFLLALGPDIAKGRIIERTDVKQGGRISGRYETIDATMTAAALLGYDEQMRRGLQGMGARPGLLIEELLR